MSENESRGQLNTVAPTRYFTALWSRRYALVVSAVLGAAVAATIVWLRPPTYRAVVDIAIGTLGKDQPLAPPDEVARLLSSPARVAELAGLPPGTVDGNDDQAGISPTAEILSNGSIVELTIEAPSHDLARTTVLRTAQALVADHGRLYKESETLRRAQIEAYRRLLTRAEGEMDVDVRVRGTLADHRPGDTVAPTLSLLPLLEDERRDRWSHVVGLEKQIADLQDALIQPASRPTRIVAGPDVLKNHRSRGIAVAALAGLLAGFVALALVIVGKAATHPRP